MNATELLSRSPRGGAFTVADLHALPDTGPRHELIDGSILVEPSATTEHNVIGHWIARHLDQSNPGEDYIVGTGQSTTVDDRNEVQPDVTVARVDVWRITPFPINKLILATEVVSKSSLLRDTETKRALYARAGVPSYWIVMPEDDSPTIALAELVLDEATGQYAYRTPYTTEVFTTDQPWPVTIDVPALTDRRAKLIREAERQAGG